MPGHCNCDIGPKHDPVSDGNLEIVDQTQVKIDVDPIIDLTVRDDQSEVVAYTSPNVPIRSVLGTLSHFPNKAAVFHWHSELERIIVLEGEMHYFVNEKVHRLSQGMGIIVNTNRLHFG